MKEILFFLKFITWQSFQNYVLHPYWKKGFEIAWFFLKKQNLQVTKLMRDFVKDKIYNKVLFLKKFISGDKKVSNKNLGEISLRIKLYW